MRLDARRGDAGAAAPAERASAVTTGATGHERTKTTKTADGQAKNEQTKQTTISNEQTKNEKTKNEKTKNEKTKNEQTKKLRIAGAGARRQPRGARAQEDEAVMQRAEVMARSDHRRLAR